MLPDIYVAACAKSAAVTVAVGPMDTKRGDVPCHQVRALDLNGRGERSKLWQKKR